MAGGGAATAIGIDLGTTYSCVAVWRNGRAEVIGNDMGNRVTPSCVAFNDHERLVGDGALNQITRNPTNTIFDAKRMIGRRFSDEVVQQDMKMWPFQVVRGENDRPTVVVQYKKEEKCFLPEEISSAVLWKMKKVATDFIGREVNKAVVTVPAYFNNAQRQATRNAGSIAGLEVIQILNEPTAAALAYSLDNKVTRSKRKILIFDLGGGTFDVSLVELDGHGVVEVLATEGDTHLGGQDFDKRMVDFIVEMIKKKQREDVSKNQRYLRKLKAACEKAKRELSTQVTALIDMDDFQNIDFSMTFTRALFEQLNGDLFESCVQVVERCLYGANVRKSNIDEVVLVGGSSRIPKVRELLKTFFEGKQLCSSVNEDEVVAVGAAIQAAILLNGDNKKEPVHRVVLLDVTPLSFGIEVKGGVMDFVVPRGSRIPFQTVKIFETCNENQTTADFAIFEGERAMTEANHLLGRFQLRGIRPAPKGETKFQVIFEIDEYGIFKVSATNMVNGDKDGITISREDLTLNRTDISRMIRDARRYELEDLEKKKQALVKFEDRDIAFDAAIQAAISNDDEKKKEPVNHIALLDVTPLSLGTEVKGGVVDFVVQFPKGSRKPCKEKIFETANKNQTTADFAFFEGERAMTEGDHQLGRLNLRGIRPAPRAGILKVSATNMDKRDKAGITISREDLTLNRNDISRMIRYARRYEHEDEEKKKAALAKNEDEVVAVGAAIRAETPNDDEKKKEPVTGTVLLDVTPVKDVEKTKSSGSWKFLNVFKSEPGSASSSISGRKTSKSKSYDQHAGDDDHEKTRKARDELRRCISRIQCFLNDDMVTSVLSYGSGNAMKSAADMVGDWLTIKEDAPYRELEEKQNMLKNLWEPLRIKLLVAGNKNFDLA